ncbi:MAG: Do family serine endopeptidase [Burkholderiaceae bacterium]
MTKIDIRPVRSVVFTALLVLATASALLPGQPVLAQSRALPDFTDLVDQVGPSVVNIRTLEKTKVSASAPGLEGMDEEMQEFFRRFFGQPLPGAPRQPRPNPNRPQPEQDAPRDTPRGVGSGFILSNDGYIMTNAHVVDGADEVLVTLTDKREFKAKIIGADKRSDVAVVKIEASALPAIKVGDVNRLKVGEWVMAIGSPFGLENSVTAGIVSAKQRDTGDFLPFIQTDVAINPGNSGGPLINMRGEVVGINSQIYSRSGGFQGISFAIPMDEAIRVSDQLRSTGRVVRGRIGVQIEPVTKEVAEAAGLGRPMGALVRGVESGAPADKAGMQAGDIITKVDGKPIEKSADLPRQVGNTAPGTKSTVTVFRKGGYKDLSVVIAEIEAEKIPVKAADKEEKPKPNGVGMTIGLKVSELTDAQKKELKVKGGVRVDASTEAAARSGLRVGDVITELDGQAISSLKEFDVAVAKVDKSKPFKVLYRRGQWEQYVMIRPTK